MSQGSTAGETGTRPSLGTERKRADARGTKQILHLLQHNCNANFFFSFCTEANMFVKGWPSAVRKGGTEGQFRTGDLKPLVPTGVHENQQTGAWRHAGLFLFETISSFEYHYRLRLLYWFTHLLFIIEQFYFLLNWCLCFQPSYYYAVLAWITRNCNFVSVELKEQLLARSSRVDDIERLKQEFAQQRQEIKELNEAELENLRTYFEHRLQVTEESHREEIALLQLRLVEEALEDSVLQTGDARFAWISTF